MAKLSVVISAFNEEKKIKDCFESVKNLADEIILVDNSSTDKTVEIAKEYGVKIYSRPNNLMLNINKNYGFGQSSGDWILNLDADERITPELANEINLELKTQNLKIDGYWIPRKNIIFGKWIKGQMWWPDEQLRLFKKGKGRFPESHIHEYIEVKGLTGHLKYPLSHLNYESVSQFLYKLDKIYSENEAENFIKSGKKINWHDAIRWPINDFLKTFFSQKGYGDGLHGLVLSLLQAFYAEIKFAKIWERKGFTQTELKLNEVAGELRQSGKEITYWLWESRAGESKGLHKLLFKILKKINGL